MNINKEMFDAIFNSRNNSIKPEDINRAKKGDINGLLSTLSNEDAKKVADALNDKEKARQILSSDAAKQILKMLGKDNNG